MGFCAVHSKRRRSLLAVLLAVGVTPAAAEDLVMPFACDVSAGQVSVVPVNEERSYRILGPREHHVFSVCAPDDPSRCRNWMIHRFDVACNGGRVSWLRLAEAALRHGQQRAWVEAGHMRLELDPRWGVSAGEPYGARRWSGSAGADPDAPYGAGEQGPAGGAVDSVELPSGFAPTLGLPVTFADGMAGETHSFDAVGGPPPAPNAAEPRGRFAASGRDEAPWRAPESAAPREGAAQPLPLGWAASPVAPPRKEKPAAVAQAKPAEPAPAVKVQKPAPLKPAVTPDRSRPAAVTAEVPAAPVSPALPSGSVAPTLINGPQGDAAAAPPVATPPAPEPPKAAEPPKVESPVVSQPETKAEAAPPSPLPAPAPKAEAATKTIPDVGLSPPAAQSAAVSAPSPFAVWALGLGAALLVAGGAVVLLSRREEPRRAFAERDLAGVSLGGGRELVPVADPAASETFLSPAQLVADDFPIPGNVADALGVLGANADAGPAALKKIVDGLRLSWHPDLARSPEDRAYRERRLAQINVAWDILEARERPAA